MNLINTGLYIHIPYCWSKCPYCDFYSVVANNELKKKKYLSALKNEIYLYSQKITAAKIQSIYLGGGTPTVLEGEQIVEILDLCIKLFKIEKGIEITIECNPATLNWEKANILLSAGVNRLSLGAQSLSNKLLKKIGRIHNKREIINSYNIARIAGFKNINLDVMFGLPGQTLKQLKGTLQEIIELYPEHISLYALSVEQGTPFEAIIRNGFLKIPQDDLVYEMYQKAIDLLVESGYEHYEISNFALSGKRSLHNQIYWKNHPYLGLGASSSSYIQGRRFKNFSDVHKYTCLLEHDILPIESKEILPLKEKMAETVILQLRMMEGLNKHDFITRFNKPIETVFPKQLKYLQKQELLKSNTTHYFLTKKGIFLANNVFVEFLD
ncbi:MAG: radical SAM family heme chaperone HemW [Atribacterota bacterium]